MKANYIEDFESWASEFKFSVPLTVRFSEIDMYGIVNNAVVISYFELARIEYLKHIGLMNDWLNPSGERVPVVADVQCDYLKQIKYDEKLNIYVKANSVGNSSVDIHYLARNEQGEAAFVGRGTLVQIGRTTGKGIPWTSKEKSLFVD